MKTDYFAGIDINSRFETAPGIKDVERIPERCRALPAKLVYALQRAARAGNHAANTRNFFPQNLTGRRYTGGNAFLLLFLCEKFQYQTPVFMTFNQAKEAGISVLKGSKSFPVYYFLFYVYHKETRKKITFEEYKALSREQQQEYNVIPTYKYYSVFNLDQTNFSDVRPEEWEALREKFRGGQAEQPEIDAMLEAKSVGRIF